GLIARAFPTRAEREAFVKTEEYKKIRALIDEARQRTGLVAGATPKKSGRFVVRLPISLHAALEREATAEGVSLNQLVVAKLAAQLSTVLERCPGVLPLCLSERTAAGGPGPPRLALSSAAAPANGSAKRSRPWASAVASRRCRRPSERRRRTRRHQLISVNNWGPSRSIRWAFKMSRPRRTQLSPGLATTSTTCSGWL